MRTSTNSRLPLVLVGVLYLILFAALLGSSERLPERVASHFNASGTADGWMSRANYLAFIVSLAVFLPGIVVGLCFALRFMPAWTFNLPNRDYWLAPERRAATNAHFFHQSLWFACLSIAFIIGVHLTTVEANSHFPPRLSTPLLLACIGGFLAGLAIWILKMLWPFLKNRSDTEGSEKLHSVHRG
jgi:uncharacterized membrane protein